MKTEPNESAFPEVNHDNPQFNTPSYGLTKREYFAAMAMQGLLSNPELLKKGSDTFDTADDIFCFYSNDSVKAADALIKALNENQ